jgi:hypothetical protein
MEAFRPVNGYNPDHPPLGRYWLGLHHHLAWSIAPPYQPDGPFVTACARAGSATAFALTIWLIGAFVTCTTSSIQDSAPAVRGTVPTAYGGPDEACARAKTGNATQVPVSRTLAAWAGPLAGLALLLMPRVYGHAHLAALETFTNLTCTAAVLAVAAWWAGPLPPSRQAAVAAGLVMGLALLSKIQAVLIPIPVIAWALVRWRRQAVGPVVLWGMTAFAVFFAAWPYLWLDPVGHLLEYLGRTTHRATLYCYYFGTRYADKAVPWHYPFVTFALTIPLAVLALILLGLGSVAGTQGTADSPSAAVSDVARWRDRLLLACGIFPLVVFAMPGVAVYDGERLFLTVFPLWAIFAGRGAFNEMVAAARFIGDRAAIIGICLACLLQFASNWRSHPSYLSYYNFSVAIAGPERLGLELNYWGDALTRDFLKEAAIQHGPFDRIEVRPSLHQFQDGDLLRQSPILRQHLSKSGSSPAPLQLAFRRRADLSDEEFFNYQQRKGPRRTLATFRDQAPNE